MHEHTREKPCDVIPWLDLVMEQVDDSDDSSNYSNNNVM
jgi:hypothetical protein